MKSCDLVRFHWQHYQGYKSEGRRVMASGALKMYLRTRSGRHAGRLVGASYEALLVLEGVTK